MEDTMVKKTQSLKEFCNAVPENQIMEYFDLYPITEIRERLLDRMYPWSIDPAKATWAEKTITDLYKQNDSFIGEKLLEWYLSDDRLIGKMLAGKNNPEEENYYEEYLQRSLQFTINLVKISPLFSKASASKYIARMMLPRKREPGKNLFAKKQPIRFYQGMPFLKDFLEELLLPNNHCCPYNEMDWCMTERASKIILESGDFSFLLRLELLVYKMEVGLGLFPSKSQPVYALDTHVAFLKCIIRELYKALEAAKKIE